MQRDPIFQCNVFAKQQGPDLLYQIQPFAEKTREMTRGYIQQAITDRPDIQTAREHSYAMREAPSQTATARLTDDVSFLRSKSARTMIVCLMMLMACEGGLRLRNLVRYGQIGTEPDIYQTNADGTQSLRPGAILAGAGPRTTINKWGLRGADFALVKPAGTTRVLCLGESTTFGQPTDDDTSVWPARLERYLKDRYPQRSFEVINGAVPGHIVSQSQEDLKKHLGRFDPDVIVVYHAATNISAYARLQESYDKKKTASPSHLAVLRDQYSLTYNLLRANTAGLMATQFPAGRLDRLDDRSTQIFSRNLGELVQECQKYCSQVILCTFPRSFDLDQPESTQRQLAGTALFFNPQLTIKGLVDAYERYNETIREVADRTAGVVLVDNDRLVPRGPDCFVDAIHLSAEGHTIVAQNVADALTSIIGQVAVVKDGDGKGTDAVQ